MSTEFINVLGAKGDPPSGTNAALASQTSVHLASLPQSLPSNDAARAMLGGRQGADYPGVPPTPSMALSLFFGPVLERNAAGSTASDVPQMGGDTPTFPVVGPQDQLAGRMSPELTGVSPAATTPSLSDADECTSACTFQSPLSDPGPQLPDDHQQFIQPAALASTSHGALAAPATDLESGKLATPGSADPCDGDAGFDLESGELATENSLTPSLPDAETTRIGIEHLKRGPDGSASGSGEAILQEGIDPQQNSASELQAPVPFNGTAEKHTSELHEHASDLAGMNSMHRDAVEAADLGGYPATSFPIGSNEHSHVRTYESVVSAKQRSQDEELWTADSIEATGDDHSLDAQAFVMEHLSHRAHKETVIQQSPELAADRGADERTDSQAKNGVVDGLIRIRTDALDPGVGALDWIAGRQPELSKEPRPVSDQLLEAIVARAEITVRDGRTDFHVRIDPPELGPVRVHLTTAEHLVSARLVVHDDAARQLIESQLDTLRRSLSDAGISLVRLDIDHEGSSSWAQGHQQRPEPVVPVPVQFSGPLEETPRWRFTPLISEDRIDVLA